MENRFSTMTEVRNVLWPGYETPEFEAANFLQGIAGTLELFHRSSLAFQDLAGEVTGHRWRCSSASTRPATSQPIDERILDDTDTLMVFGLDHLASGLEADAGEIEAIRAGCAVTAPACCWRPTTTSASPTTSPSARWSTNTTATASSHASQRFSQYTRSLMRGLDVPIHNVWGLRPATVGDSKEIAPLTASDLDTPGLLVDVPTLNFHPHLPHYELTAPESDGLRVLGRQPVDLNRPHPFTAAGNTEFNALVWMPPSGERAGDIVLIDSTHFTTLFGGTDSLRKLWRNLAAMP